MDDLKPEELDEESKPQRGGRRPGAGRKPNKLKALRDQVVGDKHAVAEYAFNLYTDTLQDTSVDIAVRLDCGKEIMDRVWGKPKQAIKHSGDDTAPVRIVVEYVDRIDLPGVAPPPPSGPGPDPPGDEAIQCS
jgi:hypothetical protein